MNKTPTLALAGLIDCIRDELSAVEELFERELRSDLPCVNTLVRHVSRFRGKMLRPSLLLLAGKACGQTGPGHIVLATVVEMVHMATLVHDDVLDDAELRRKGATINHLKGNEAAVLLGDYLISHSYHLCSSLQNQLAARAIARTTNQVCEGELLQLDNRHRLDLDEATYLRIIALKTASLCAACCQLGATFAGADEATVRRMEEYGRALGMAFQVQDDILDIVGEAATVGKTLGSDIEKGKMTLPLIHFLQSAPREHGMLLRSLLEGREPDRAEKIRNLVVPGDSIAYAAARARMYVDAARAALSFLPDSDARRALDAMAEFAVSRPM